MRLRRLKSLILALTAGVLLAAVAFVAFDLLWRRDRTIEEAQVRSARLAAAISEYVGGAFALADTSLRQLAIHSQRVGGPSAPASEWLPLLEAAHAGLAGSGSLSVTDAEGVIRHSTIRAIIGQRRHDNYVFRYLTENDPKEMIVDEPFLSPIHARRYVLPVARRLETPAGRFDGLVVCVVTPDRFRTFFKTIDVGANGIIWVFHPNGIVLFREPSEHDALGEQAPDNPLVVGARTRPGGGVLEGPLTAGGPEYISAYRSLSAPPLVVAVSLSRHEVLADWRTQRRNSAIAAIVFSALLAGFVFLTFRQIDARSSVERELASAQQQEAERLREANEALAEALAREKEARDASDAAGRMKDEFLMTLSHELRTPLNAILGWVRMLATGAVRGSEATRALAIVERNAQAQARLVEDLLDVSRAVSGKLHLHLRPVDVREVIAAAVETLRPALSAKGLAFEASVAPAIPTIRADPDRVQQVVWNLLSNAIKFTPAGGGVSLMARSASEGIEIVVRDTGAGIPPAFMPFVFDRFRQADTGTRRETPGLGLGLAISRHIVELHGGTITAESAGEGQGTTMTVRLPATAPNAER